METAQLLVEQGGFDTFRLVGQQCKASVQMLNSLLALTLTPPMQADLAMDRCQTLLFLERFAEQQRGFPRLAGSFWLPCGAVSVG